VADRSAVVPLTPLQAAIAELLSINRSPDSYLAGGAALHIAPNSKRYSNDLDYFHDSEERVARAFADDLRLLREHGYGIEVLLQQPGYVRALVKKDDATTKVEWAHDSSWRFLPRRFLPTIRTEQAGYQLNPIDLAINKLLALVGRDEPRDYLDIHEAMRLLPLGALCWAAAGKDPGFTPPMLLDLLRRRGKYRPEDFARLELAEQVDLPALKSRWLAALADAERFFATCDPTQIGCLFYSPLEKRFVQPAPGETVIPHYGRPGGVLPAVGG
jgi:hypothetical protein